MTLTWLKLPALSKPERTDVDRPKDTTCPCRTDDPTTVVGLIYRVLDRPHRTLGLIAILSVILGAFAELLDAPAIAGLHPTVWGFVISGTSVTPAIVRIAFRRVTGLRSRERTTPDSPTTIVD